MLTLTFAPTAADKYIQGHKGTVAAQDGAPGGSYLTATTSAGSGNMSDYMFVIDYRILRAYQLCSLMQVTMQVLHKRLPQVSMLSQVFTTMNVKYVLLEDQ
jgi:hypothetical protein